MAARPLGPTEALSFWLSERRLSICGVVATQKNLMSRISFNHLASYGFMCSSNIFKKKPPRRHHLTRPAGTHTDLGSHGLDLCSCHPSRHIYGAALTRHVSGPPFLHRQMEEVGEVRIHQRRQPANLAP